MTIEMTEAQLLDLICICTNSLHYGETDHMKHAAWQLHDSLLNVLNHYNNEKHGPHPAMCHRAYKCEEGDI